MDPSLKSFTAVVTVRWCWLFGRSSTRAAKRIWSGQNPCYLTPI